MRRKNFVPWILVRANSDFKEEQKIADPVTICGF